MTIQDNIIPMQKPERDRLVCTACLANVEVTCDCGAEHKRMRPGELARLAVEKYPTISNRLIAERIGVDPETVRRARIASEAETGAAFAAPGARLGRDGRLYPVSAPKDIEIEVDESDIKPALPQTEKEQAENIFGVLSEFADQAIIHSLANCSGGYFDCTILKDYKTKLELQELANKCLKSGEYWTTQGNHILSLLKGRKT